MIFPARHPFYDVVIQMSKTVKYKDYLADLYPFVNPYYHEENPVQALSNRLSKAGFKLLHVELREFEFQFSSLEDLESKKSKIETSQHKC